MSEDADMMDLLTMHKYFLQAHLHPGSHACDFTMGNGHDTLWLANAVGNTGHVDAFDIQPEAVAHTKARLAAADVLDRCRLICDSHARVCDYVKEPFDAGVFNLGWLPGSDKTITTCRESTLPAVQNALSLVAPGGILLVAVYPGHSEGAAEGEALLSYFSAISRFSFSISRLQIVNAPDAPYFFAAERKS